MNPKSFFGELRRRNVYKVAIAYGVVAWLLIQGARDYNLGFASRGSRLVIQICSPSDTRAAPAVSISLTLGARYA